MAKAKTLKPKQTRDVSAAGSYADNEARSRFERAVDVAVATKPLHREAPARKQRQK